jgi:fructose-1-phosphate kinase PfkB-like protein
MEQGMSGNNNGCDGALQSARTYHAERVSTEQSLARASGCASARASHERLAALHQEELRRLEEIVVIRAEVLSRVG